jgi:glycosyltransferase involved in cell wall biosynthesis
VLLSKAMAMQLPVIATNWSGITAFLDDSVGYLIPVEKLVPAGGDAKFAQPSLPHLRTLMRRVASREGKVAEKVAAARARVVERYSPSAMAELVLAEWRRIDAALSNR